MHAVLVPLHSSCATSGAPFNSPDTGVESRNTIETTVAPNTDADAASSSELIARKSGVLCLSDAEMAPAQE